MTKAKTKIKSEFNLSTENLQALGPARKIALIDSIPDIADSGREGKNELINFIFDTYSQKTGPHYDEDIIEALSQVSVRLAKDHPDLALELHEKMHQLEIEVGSPHPLRDDEFVLANPELGVKHIIPRLSEEIMTCNSFDAGRKIRTLKRIMKWNNEADHPDTAINEAVFPIMMKVVSDIKRLDNPVNTMEIKDTNIYLKDKIREIIGDSIIHFARADLSKTRIMLRTVVDNGLGDGLCGSTCDNRCTPIIEALSYVKSEFEGIEGLGLMLGEIALRAGNSPYQNDGLKYFLKKFPDILKAERDPERQEELMRVVLNTIDFPLDKEYSAIVLEMAKVNPIKAFAFVDKLIDQMDGSCNRGNGYYPALLENVVTDEVIEVLESINKKSTQFLIERWEQKRIYSKDETLLSEEEQKAAKKERSEQRQLARNSFRDVQGALLEQFDVRL